MAYPCHRKLTFLFAVAHERHPCHPGKPTPYIMEVDKAEEEGERKRRAGGREGEREGGRRGEREGGWRRMIRM